MKITTENIRVNFQAKEILKGISIETRDKELVGIIGPNGSGKSTLLKCIYRVLCYECKKLRKENGGGSPAQLL